MRKVDFYYLEVLNETQQLMIFTTKFNKQKYGQALTLNTVLPVEVQDIQIRKTIEKVQNIKQEDAKEATA